LPLVTVTSATPPTNVMSGCSNNERSTGVGLSSDSQNMSNNSAFRNRGVPVMKWALKFSGDQGSLSIAAFLERVEELRVARGISEFELYESAVDLFEGQALVWFRSVRRRVTSWAELKRELKLVFQKQDYNERLWKEIENRTQAESENIDIYLAIMDNLLARLSTPVDGTRILDIIMKNLNCYLQDKLCMYDIRSIEELRTFARRAELGRTRSSSVMPPPRPQLVMEPDLAFSRNCVSNKNSGKVKSNVNTLQVSTKKDQGSSSLDKAVNADDAKTKQKRCWNCHLEGHTFTDCKEPRKGLFCFRCGRRGTVSRDCQRCTKN